MAGQKLEYARQAAAFAVDQLRAGDRVSVVAFDDRVETVVASTTATDKARLKQGIARITERGSTALHAGWVEGGAQVGAHLKTGCLNRVILFTDGQANVGETNPDTIANDVHGLATRGVSTSTLGIGSDYNEDLLEAMARSGDGNYYFIESPGQLAGLFAAELRGLLATVGRNVSLGLEPGPGVEILEVFNELPRNWYGRLQLPNLLAGSAPVEVTLRLRVPAGFDAERSVCRCRLAWDDPKGGERQKMREKLRLPLLAPAEVDALAEDADTATAVALLRAAREKRKAVEALERGDRQAYRTQQPQRARVRRVRPAGRGVGGGNDGLGQARRPRGGGNGSVHRDQAGQGADSTAATARPGRSKNLEEAGVATAKEPRSKNERRPTLEDDLIRRAPGVGARPNGLEPRRPLVLHDGHLIDQHVAPLAGVVDTDLRILADLGGLDDLAVRGHVSHRLAELVVSGFAGAGVQHKAGAGGVLGDGAGALGGGGLGRRSRTIGGGGGSRRS